MHTAKRFYTYIKAYKPQLFLSVVFHVLSAFFTVVSIPLIIPFFEILFETKEVIFEQPVGKFDINGHLRQGFNVLLSHYSKKEALLLVCLSVGAVFFLKNLTRYLAAFFVVPVRNGIVADLREKLFSKYLDLPLSYFSSEKKGNLITKLSADVQEVEFSILNALEASFKAPFVMLGSLLFMLVVSVKLSFFVAILLVFVVVVIGGISRQLKKQSAEAQGYLGEVLSIAEESLGGMKVIKAFDANETLKSTFQTTNSKYKNMLNRILRRRDLSSPLSEFLGVSVVTVLLYYGSHLVFTEQLSPGTFFAFIFAFYQVIEPAKVLSNAYYSIQKGLASLDRIEAVLSLENPIQKNSGDIAVDRFSDAIVLDHVHFSYSDDTQVLNDIQLTIPKGKMTALVGLSGSGKTTLADLLLRYYDVTEGSILLDGMDIRSLSLKHLRSLFGMVTQEPFLMHDSIMNNIRFGMHSKSNEEVIAAAKLAYAHDFIEQQPNGYNTIIGDRGTKLSGGQRQRIALARTILRDPQIVVFDEATSALDAESEKLIQDAMIHFFQDRTAIVIAHRLATVQNADQIVVLKAGHIVEKGTHKTLIDHQGEYAKYVDLQNLN